MNGKGCGRKRSWPNLRYYPGICLEGLRKATKNFSQDSRSPGRDLNSGPPEYEAGMLTTRPRCTVRTWQNHAHNCRVWWVSGPRNEPRTTRKWSRSANHSVALSCGECNTLNCHSPLELLIYVSVALLFNLRCYGMKEVNGFLSLGVVRVVKCNYSLRTAATYHAHLH
jgi:hypothetical protein